jgi:hypothetical protein
VPFLLRLLLWGLAATAPQFAQSLLLGFKAGIPMTQYFDTRSAASLSSSADYSAATRRYTAGVSAEWRSETVLGIEADVLYKRMGYVGIIHTIDSSRGISTTAAFDIKGDSWDFPILLKYRFRRKLHPYASGGGVVRYVGPVQARGEETAQDLVAGTTTRTPIDTADPFDLRKRFYPGVSAGSGVELRRGRLRLLPELRYTRWTANIAKRGGLLRFEPDQWEWLLGVLF